MPAKFAKKVFKTSNNNANDVPPPTLNDVDDSAAAIVDAFAEINEEHQPKQQLQQTQQQVRWHEDEGSGRRQSSAYSIGETWCGNAHQYEGPGQRIKTVKFGPSMG